MEQQTPPPPHKSRLKPREGQKRAILGGGRGGVGFPFILSKIVVKARLKSFFAAKKPALFATSGL